MPKISPKLFIFVILTLTFLYMYTFLLSSHISSSHSSFSCNLFNGRWIRDPTRKPMYDDTCPFHRNSWNCLRNKRDRMDIINNWKWVPRDCHLPQINPSGFLRMMRNKRIGFVGDSLNENFLVSFLCILRLGDMGAKKWKRKGAWRGAYFPTFNVTVAYHRSVLLASYQYLGQPKQYSLSDQDVSKGIYRVDVDIPADDWANVTDYYDVLIFNTGHWWGYDKFPKETPLVFYREGRPILPALDTRDGLKVVLESMASYIQNKIPSTTLKFWRMQSPRHFYGGDWNQNGSCLFDELLEEHQLDMWFDPIYNGVNKEERQLNNLIEEVLRGTDIQLLDLSYLSEFRADAHPAIWLGKKDAVSIWGQDCMHWCLPGVPDTWVDVLSRLIHTHLRII